MTMSSKFCTRSETWQPLENFYDQPTSADGKSSSCKEVIRATSKRSRKRDPVKYSALRKERYADNVAWIRAIKMESGCVVCGYNEHPAALEFDHLEGFVKSFSIAEKMGSSRELLRAEMAKCEIVCSVCHAVRTYNRRKGIPLDELRDTQSAGRRCCGNYTNPDSKRVAPRPTAGIHALSGFKGAKV
jgi:hypothetical protein